jgi:hypothetical protein
VDVAGQQTDFVKFFLVKWHIVVATLHGLHQALALHGVQLFAAGAFDFRLKVMGHMVAPLSK